MTIQSLRCVALAVFLCALGLSEGTRAETACQADPSGGYQPPAGTTWCDGLKPYWDKAIEEAKAEGKDTTSCDGNRQSPIDLKWGTYYSENPGRVAFRFPTSSDLTLRNSGHSVELLLDPEEYPDGKGKISPPGVTPAKPPTRFMAVEGKRYKLSNFHFHHPSEHLLDGKRFAMELHMVYEAVPPAQGRAVLGVLLELGEKNDALDVLFSNMSDTSAKGATKSITVSSADIMRVLPADRSYVYYEGSLTTPTGKNGCDEDVAWRVFQKPIQVSQAQVDAFKEAIKTPLGGTVNARPWRDSGMRFVTGSHSYLTQPAQFCTFSDPVPEPQGGCTFRGWEHSCGWFRPLTCLSATGNIFGNPVAARLYAGLDLTRFMVDVNGDGKPDYCRMVRQNINNRSYLFCALQGKDDRRGFEPVLDSVEIFTKDSLDPGSEPRFMADVNGDGFADFCRFVGDGANRRFHCARAFAQTASGAFGPRWVVNFVDDVIAKPWRGGTVEPGLDPGYDDMPRFLVDVNGDGRADFCRFVGYKRGHPQANLFLSCALSTGLGFNEPGYDVNSKPLFDAGDLGRPIFMADVNGDGMADYCRFVGPDPTSQNPKRRTDPWLSCALSTGTGFGEYDFYPFAWKPGDPDDPSPSILTGPITTAAMVDVNGDGKADYCRFLGVTFGSVHLSCALSTGTGFGPEEVKAPTILEIDPQASMYTWFDSATRPWFVTPAIK